jgi:hypothetical protein
VAQSVADELGHGTDFEFAEEVGAMALDSFDADPEFQGEWDMRKHAPPRAGESALPFSSHARALAK